MSLARLLESQFRGDIRFRGAAYLEAERVEVVRVTPDELYGVVRDGTEYETHLSRQNTLFPYATLFRSDRKSVV